MPVEPGIDDGGAAFRRRMAERDEDSTKWTPRDALQHALDEIDGSLVDGLVIHYHEKQPDGRVLPRYFCADMSHERHVAMLEVAKHVVLQEWLA